ncbi:MAG: hypothetical protein WBY94_25170 [Polyangiaceae bacterium]
MSRISDHRVWLLLASLTIAVFVWACSSDTSSGPSDSGGSNSMSGG